MNIYKLDIIVLRLKFLLNMNLEAVQRMRKSVYSYHKQHENELLQEQRNLEKKATEENDFESQLALLHLDDEFYFNNEAKELADGLSIIALYKQIEITTKKAVIIAYPDVNARSLFGIDQMKGTLNNKGIDITSFADFAAFDELRCINNDAKHAGVIGKQLGAYPEWIEGEPLSNLQDAYERLEPKCSSYVKEFVQALIDQRL